MREDKDAIRSALQAEFEGASDDSLGFKQARERREREREELRRERGENDRQQ
ncbi:hypothetical protein OS242_19715 [Tumebacillus sp. DT12]|uniref:YfhD family protein n=1 Tax=Tumebacillus lacus TaxID=2995335 RepID=A0ABT3X963_9BACL|nr:hypothetical protein [Tumebacillus lacus]MCX7572155.1 hypothetical protein [Tumebacillus lacus]